jgi:LacI family transcriptional regulator
MENVRQSDIAKELNVSRVTVSKSLRNHPDISPGMKGKVNKIAKELGYIPNLIAKQLNSRKTFTLGIVIPDLENSFFAYIVDSIIDFATEKDYHILLTVSREKEVQERLNIENLIGMRVDGLLVCLSQETQDATVFSQLKKMKIPTVFFDRAFKHLGFSTVVFNDRKGAVDALDQVILSGYTRIAHFAGYSKTNIGNDRSEGYREALKKHKLPVQRKWILEGGFEVKDGYNSFMKLVKQGDLPEIIFAVNDRVALGAYKAARASGLKIATDIGIMAYGFSETAEMLHPTLTIINQDPRKMGQIAVETLFEEINTKTKYKPKKVLIEEEFLWKNSVVRRTKLHKPK